MTLTPDGGVLTVESRQNRIRLLGDRDGNDVAEVNDFLTGFLVNPDEPDTWARPIGLLVLPDGSLLLAEDGNSRIYSISYSE